ncbi:MAG: acyl-CoA dehydrogenase family protein [Pseudomonadota bacterium]
MSELEAFRQETRTWLEENCPPAMQTPGDPYGGGGGKQPTPHPDAVVWLDRMAKKGWTAPTWPKEYGGGGLNREENQILQSEMRRINARTPLVGMGTSMIGPTLLDFGTEEQKKEHIPKIVTGEIRWCQGYSEPNAGSDLASLQTRAEDHGDHFIINGQKIWTSGAQYADWMFCLVRTDPKAPKHEGISFVLFPMDDPGVTIRPIKLISGTSPFCETFFDNVKAEKKNLVGELNRGWTIGKRLLQHERSSIGGAGGGRRNRDASAGAIIDFAKKFKGEEDGRIADKGLRSQIAGHRMKQTAYGLTQRRAAEESKTGATPGDTTSVFKYYLSILTQERTELLLDTQGLQGCGWEGDSFTNEELAMVRDWLGHKAFTIYGGTSEIQLNIIAKRVLELPEE